MKKAGNVADEAAAFRKEQKMATFDVKILGLSCSYKKAGETAWLVQYALEAAEEFGKRLGETGNVTTEFVDLAEKEIKPFLKYYQWSKTPNEILHLKPTGVPGDFGCVEEQDYMEELWSKITAADGFIFGSPVSVGSASSKFRVLCERLTSRVRKGYLTNKPAGLIAVGWAPLGGQESCLRHMANCLRELEMIEVSWMLGVPAVIDPTFDSEFREDVNMLSSVKADEFAKRLAVFSARRVVEFALMQKIAKLELCSLYQKEFMQVYHQAQPEETWFWDTLDKEDNEFFMTLEGTQKGETWWTK